MTLTSENVETVLKDCLLKEGEDTSGAVIIKGIVQSYGFNPGRVRERTEDIRSMLECLPDDFMSDKGGGMSFLNACMTREGEQWGEHRSMEQLFALGEAAGSAKPIVPREMWKDLPGSMPYYTVLRENEKATA